MYYDFAVVVVAVDVAGLVAYASALELQTVLMLVAYWVVIGNSSLVHRLQNLISEAWLARVSDTPHEDSMMEICAVKSALLVESLRH